ncbi:MAG: hypothetical protein FWD81_04500 [Methanomassiliicoccaceae archaeon]|nr:hypothetical protein [Methanomassiliicoccaceae archaeon]
MMEFTIARVCMGICGLILLAAVVVPVTGMYESHTVSMESDIPDEIAYLIDDFYYSKMDTFTVPMSDILPNPSSYAEFDGYLVTMTTERGTYKGGTNVLMMTSDGVFGYGDILKLSRSSDTVIMEKLT